jgi:hypothetical protein
MAVLMVAGAVAVAMSVVVSQVEMGALAVVSAVEKLEVELTEEVLEVEELAEASVAVAA